LRVYVPPLFCPFPNAIMNIGIKFSQSAFKHDISELDIRMADLTDEEYDALDEYYTLVNAYGDRHYARKVLISGVCHPRVDAVIGRLEVVTDILALPITYGVSFATQEKRW